MTFRERFRHYTHARERYWPDVQAGRLSRSALRVVLAIAAAIDRHGRPVVMSDEEVATRGLRDASRTRDVRRIIADLIGRGIIIATDSSPRAYDLAEIP